MSMYTTLISNSYRSSDSNNSSKCMVLVVVRFRRKEKSHISKQDRAAMIRVHVESWRIEINKNIIHVVKYEYDEYFEYEARFHGIRISMNAYMYQEF